MGIFTKAGTLIDSMLIKVGLVKKPKVWGWDLMVDCSGGNSNIDDKVKIQEFINELVNDIDMVAYGPTWIELFATHDFEKAGITAIQPLMTSSATFHFCSNSGDMFGNIFSCKEFDDAKVIVLLNKYFEFKNIRHIKHDRYV